MKLELKHLAPYLPYSIKFTVPIHKFHKGAPYENRVLTMNESPKLCLEHGKPILRPLSGLSENELYALKLESNTNGIENFGDIWFGGVISLEDMEYILSKLFEWHIDVFGLIEKGLAIDINTIKI